MKPTKFLFLLLLIALLIWLYLNKNSQIVSHSNSSQSQITSSTKKSKTNKAITKTPKTPTKTEVIVEDSVVDQQIVDPSLSYLSAFRNFTFFLICKTAIDDTKEYAQPIDAFRAGYETNMQYGYAGGAEHESYFLLHIDHCKNLLATENETYLNALVRLEKIYQSIEPISEEEKELASILDYFDDYAQSKKHLKAQRRGISTLSESELDQLNRQLKISEDLLKPIRHIPIEKRTPEQDAIITEHYNSSNVIRDKIRKSYDIDSESIKQASQNHNQRYNTFLQKVSNAKSSDIFAIQSLSLYFSPLSEFSNISSIIVDQAKIDLNINNKDYLHIIADIAIPLFSCSLGYPCDSESIITTNHCIVKQNRNACGKSVEEFYLNYYTSPNLLEDVNIFINYLIEQYGE